MDDPFSLLTTAVNSQVSVTLADGEVVTGRLICFDDRCNIGLGDAVRSSMDEPHQPVSLKIIRGDMILHVVATVPF
jgi:small nuclear ribonucleoprotein (snRNP)-like protein